MHINHLKHSDFENLYFRYIIWHRAFHQKIHFFANFRAHTLTNVAGSCALNFDATDLPQTHIASLNRHTPKFSGVGLKFTWCQPFAIQGLPKSGNPDWCPPKMAILRCFFCCKESVFLAKWTIFAYIACHT